MRLSLSIMLRNSRAARERRLLESAMRTTSAPVPAAGLKERLIEQAITASRQSIAEPTRSYRWIAWAAAGFAFVVLAIWLSLSPETQQTVATKPASHPERITRTAPPRIIAQGPDAKPNMALVPDLHSRPANTWGQVRPVHRRSVNYHSQPIEPTTAQAPGTIRVSVTRKPEQAVGYARVAAYTRDDSGRQVKTSWTLMNDPKTRTSEQEVAIDDTAGQRQLLRVSVVMPSRDPNGEQL